MTVYVQVNGVKRPASSAELAQMAADAAYMPVPAQVTKRQLRLQLLADGRLDAAEAAVAASNDNIKITWADMTIVERSSPMLNSLAKDALGMTDADIDATFIAAAQR